MRKKPEVSLKNRALQYLARREYSRAELRAKLLQHAVSGEDDISPPDTDVDELLDELTTRGWLSDQRAAAQLVDRRRGRFGVQRITHELHQKGLEGSLIEEILPQIRESELDAARDVWLRKFGTVPRDAKEKARQMRFLQSRGFSAEIIRCVLRDAAVPDES